MKSTSNLQYISIVLIITLFISINILASEKCCQISVKRPSCLEHRIDHIDNVLLYLDKGYEEINLLQQQKKRIPHDDGFKPYVATIDRNINFLQSTNEIYNYRKRTDMLPEDVYTLRNKQCTCEKKTHWNLKSVESLPTLTLLPTTNQWTLAPHDYTELTLACLTIKVNVIEFILDIPKTKHPTSLTTRIDNIEEQLVNEFMGDLLLNFLKNGDSCIQNRVEKLKQLHSELCK